jgi:hypothetical protein
MNLIEYHDFARERQMPENKVLASQARHKHLINRADDEIRQIPTLTPVQPRVHYRLDGRTIVLYSIIIVSIRNAISHRIVVDKAIKILS